MIVEHLLADQFGTHIGKYSKRLKITQKGETLAEAPIMHLQSVTVASRGVSISSDALEACCEYGIPVHFTTKSGESYATVYSAGLGGTILTRRQQILAYFDKRGLEFARTIAEAKIQNQATTLKYLAKTRKDTYPDIYEHLRLSAGDVLDCLAYLDRLSGECVEDCRGSIMAAEGQAAHHYWEAIGNLLPNDYGWPGRVGRGASDAVNSLLNYGYGILYRHINQAIVLAGLDPYAGFLHADRSGKPSLVLDLIEEFRQTVVDRPVLGLLNTSFSVEQHDDGLLKKDTRHRLTERIHKHLEARMRYQGKRVLLRFIIQSQARHLASFLRGDCEDYQAFGATY